MEAFKESVFPDKLEGDNRYYCHTCQKKCDALKGSNWIRLPYILTLHLKRFDFDYMTMEKKKLTNKLTFPEILNLNPFLSDSNQPIESFIEGIHSKSFPEPTYPSWRRIKRQTRSDQQR
eukprot:TRINITY_DN2502_c0_g1_i1.p1 TRINITY_DN2502_c0_g1~~TRINITY_DN2502_c0_g1_i1.p1  ORF type:complete len:119 (+),score=23.38 TRINITY_DN2502_c0_g1_i1:539-895(+)